MILLKKYPMDIRTQERIAIAIVLIFAAIGVFLLTLSRAVDKGYKTLIAWENVAEKDGRYLVHYKISLIEKIMGIYWETVLALYIVISFITFGWKLTWVIVPIASIINEIIDKYFEKE